MKLEIKKDDFTFTVLERYNDTETFIVNRSIEFLPLWEKIVLRYNLHEELIEALEKTVGLCLGYMANSDNAAQSDYDILEEIDDLIYKAKNKTQL